MMSIPDSLLGKTIAVLGGTGPQGTWSGTALCGFRSADRHW